MRYILRRPRAFWISLCNLVGLAFSVAGVVLLLLFALPPEVPGTGTVLTGDNSNPVKLQAETRRFTRNAHIGLALVSIGTLLEAVPPFCTALGSWRRRPSSPQVQRPHQASYPVAGEHSEETAAGAPREPAPQTRHYEPPSKG
jgi:hypothetical protein